MHRLARHLSSVPRPLLRSRAGEADICLSCGRPVARGDERLMVRGAAFHARCSAFRGAARGRL